MERRQALAECFESFVDEGDDCMSTDNPHILSIGWALHGAKWDTKHAPRLFAKLSRSSTTVTQHHFVDFFLSKCMQLSDEKFDELLTALRSQADGDSCDLSTVATSPVTSPVSFRANPGDDGAGSSVAA